MIRNIVLVLSLFLLVSCSSEVTVGHCGEWEEAMIAGGTDYVEGELIVSFIEGVSVESAQVILEWYSDLTIDHSFGTRATFVVNVTSGTEIEWICSLKGHSLIDDVELSFVEENSE